MTDLDLDAWQQRLETHFSEIAGTRKIAFPNEPVFALEHGLDLAEVEALSAALRVSVTKETPKHAHGLAWVVYASELGYRYSGDEYWQTFELDTPGWIVHGDRYWLRKCFLKFREKYGGAKPSGQWAQHFSIICWPITHAILPRDLQRQLARILYDVRHSFSREVFEFPAKLGELIAANSWDSTSRFQNFVQEPSLVGQIAVALLLEAEPGTTTLIHPKTLERIGTDLDRERRAREWLRNARRFAKTGARIRAVATRRDYRVAAGHQSEVARAQVAALGIEPRLLLRPTDASNNAWSVACEIPGLSNLLIRFPELRDLLTGSRCVVAGAAGPPLARNRLLYGEQRVRLTRWPKSEEVLLKFERSAPQLEYLLRTECLLRPGPLWLFRTASDGLAYEVRSLTVRPNQQYILLSTRGPIASNELARATTIECDDVYGVVLNLPSALTTEWEEQLRQLGLQQAKTIEVWPAGLPATQWDSEACGEWPVSERPCFAICPDHPVRALIACLKDEPGETPLEIESLLAGEVIFVQLPQLHSGLHRLMLTARSGPEAVADSATEFEVGIRIRDAHMPPPNMRPSRPLLVQVYPTEPTLEQLWDGQVELTARGPLGRYITCAISLFERHGTPAILRKVLPAIPLPISVDSWQTHFEKHFRKSDDVQEAFDVSRICEVEFKANELGQFFLRCEREFTPLRWSLRHRGRSNVVTLIDDSGADAIPKIHYMAFKRPMNQAALTYSTEYKVPANGGLYVAERETAVAALIAPPMLRGLSDLRCEVSLPTTNRSLEAVAKAIEVASLWTQAKLPGDFFSALQRRDVLLAFAHYVAELICGTNWARAEIEAGRGDRQFNSLREAISKHPEHAALGKVLEDECSGLLLADPDKRIARLALISSKFGLVSKEDDLQWLCQLALRLASDPGNVEAWAGAKLRMGLKQLVEEATTLARAARFVVLAVTRRSNLEPVASQLYGGWKWD